MSTNIGYATLSVIPGMSGFQSSLQRGIDPAMTSAGKRAGSRFGSAFKGTLGAIGLFSAASGALRFLGDSVDEGREAVRVGKQTAAVIKSTGGVARVTEKQVGRLAGQLSRVAGIDDEIVQGGSNILLTFKNVRNEAGENNKIFDKANKAALNLSVALDKDLAGSATMVGKALNDPVAGMTALGRAGVQFTADQKDAIKNAVETGDTLGAQKIILQELNDQFKGSAKAQRTEADRLKVSWGNFKEEIGTALIPVLDDLAKFMRKEGIPKAKEFFAVVRDDGVPALKKVAGFAKDAAGEVKDLVDAFNGMPDWVKKTLAAGAVGGFAAKKLGVGKAIGGQVFSKGATPVNPLYVFVTNPGGVTPGVPDGKPRPGTIKRLGKQVLPVALVATSLVGVDQLLKESTAKFPKAKPSDFGASNEGYVNFSRAATKELDTVQFEWDETRNRASDYFQLIQRNKNVQLRFTVAGMDLATQKARDYYSLLLQIRGAVNENKLDAAGGSGPTTPSSGGGKSGGKPSGRGIVVNNTYNVNTTGDAEKWDKHRRQQVAMGGFG